ncbi:glycosyltransferase family 2 protein [Glycomyces halotolerans]
MATDPALQGLLAEIEQEIGLVHGVDAIVRPEQHRFEYRSRLYGYRERLAAHKGDEPHPDIAYFEARLAMALNEQDAAVPLWLEAISRCSGEKAKLARFHLAICQKNIGAYHRARESLASCERQRLDRGMVSQVRRDLDLAESKFVAHCLGGRYFDLLRSRSVSASARAAFIDAYRDTGASDPQLYAVSLLCEVLEQAARGDRIEVPVHRHSETEPHRQVFFAGFGWTGSGACFDYYAQSDHAVAPFGAGELTLYRTRFLDALYRRGDENGDKAWRALLDYLELTVFGLIGRMGGQPGGIQSRSVLHSLDGDGLAERLAHSLGRLMSGYREGDLRRSVTRFLNDVTNLGDQPGAVHLFNNSISGILADRIDLLPDAKLVAVVRDIRDVYVARSIESGRMDPEAFVKSYRWSFNEFQKWYEATGAKHRVSVVRFEDFVTSESCRRALGDEIGVPVDSVPVSSDSYHPSVSVRNVGLYKTSELQEELGRVAEALPEFVWGDHRSGTTVLSSVEYPNEPDEARLVPGLSAVKAGAALSPEEIPAVYAGAFNPSGFKSRTDRPAGVMRLDSGAITVPSDSGYPEVIPGDRPLRDFEIEHLRQTESVEVRWGHRYPSPQDVYKLRQLAVLGVPLYACDAAPAWADALLGTELVDDLRSYGRSDRSNPLLREHHSIALRRIGLDTFSTIATRGVSDVPGSDTGLPAVSAVLCSNRPEFVEQAIEQVRAQNYPNLELIVTLHGPAGDLAAKLRSDEDSAVPLIVVEVPSDVLFGEALNRGVRAASGTIVTKIDDDDWYGPNHVWDMVRAMRYSKADIVGAFAEFVYLGPLDVTVFRPAGGGERYGSSLSGGTLTLTHDLFLDIGGYPAVSTGADRGLMQALEAARATVYRTHGMGYLLNRHDRGHTWEIEISHFLQSAQHQWHGTNLAHMVLNDQLGPFFAVTERISGY